MPDYAFRNCDAITSITIPESTVSIGDYAFANCKALSKLNNSTVGVLDIPADVTEIGNCAFINVGEISKVIISDDVTSIGGYAFSGCSSITQFNSDTMNELIVPEACEKIGDYAFQKLTLITHANVSNKVSTIGRGTFSSCSSLVTLHIPFIGLKNTVNETLNQYPFGVVFGTSSYTGGISTRQYFYGSSLSSTTNDTYYIPSSLKTVYIALGDLNYGAFYGCSNITDVYCKDVAIVNENAFKNSTATLHNTLAITDNAYAWNGREISNSFNSGNGTEQNPYIIVNGAQLAFFAEQVNSGNSYNNTYFALGSDINLAGYLFPVIGNENYYFNEYFDGLGYVIRNLNISSIDKYAGLFGYTTGSIRNVGVEKANVSVTTTQHESCSGVLVGFLGAGGNVFDCYASGSLTAKCDYTIYAGGLCGYISNGGFVSNSYADVKVLSTSVSLIAYAGGFVGFNDGGIVGSFAKGDVSAKGSTDAYSRNGGFVGDNGNNGSISNSFKLDSQTLTKYGTSGKSFNDYGTSANISEIISYCKINWSGSVWSFNKALPSF